MGQDWQRVARIVRKRRAALGLTQDAPGGPSKASWYKVENAIDPPYRESTKRAVERALKWVPGSIDQILDGGEPIQRGEPIDAPPPPDPGTLDPGSLETMVFDLDRRLTAVEAIVKTDDGDSDIPERYRRLLAELPPDEADALRVWWRDHRGPPPAAEQAS